MKFSAVTLITMLGAANAWHVQLFSNANFEGTRINLVGPPGECADVPGEINDKTTSLKGDRGDQCIFYLNSGCDTPLFQTRPKKNIKDLGPNDNDKISSVKCL